MFRTGDRVRLVNFIKKFDGLMGTIVEVRDTGRKYLYVVSIYGKASRYLVYADEIEPAVKIGEQLLLFEL